MPCMSSLYVIGSDVLSNIDHKNKQYTQTSLDEMCNLLKETERFRLEYMKALMPDSKKDKPLKVTINEDKKNVKVAGYSTTKYKVFENDELKEVIWISSDKKLMNEQKIYRTFEEEFNCMKHNDYTSSDEYKKLTKIGFPLKSYSDSGNNIDDVDFTQLKSDDNYGAEYFEVIKVDFSDISKATFQIPADYKKVTPQQNFSEEENVENNESSINSQQEDMDKLKEIVGDDSSLGKFLSDALGDG